MELLFRSSTQNLYLASEFTMKNNSQKKEEDGFEKEAVHCCTGIVLRIFTYFTFIQLCNF